MARNEILGNAVRRFEESGGDILALKGAVRYFGEVSGQPGQHPIVAHAAKAALLESEIALEVAKNGPGSLVFVALLGLTARNGKKTVK
jgi:hypothetical protein